MGERSGAPTTRRGPVSEGTAPNDAPDPRQALASEQDGTPLNFWRAERGAVGSGEGAGLFELIDDVGCDVTELDVAVGGESAHHLEGRMLVQAVSQHQQALGDADGVPVLKGRAEAERSRF